MLHHFSRILVLCMALCAQAVSANWVSGGGVLERTQNNPWFMGNVSDVTYCIYVNESKTSLSKEHIRKVMTRAFGYWKNEFKYAMAFDWRNVFDAEALRFLQVGRQNFVEQSCASSLEESLAQNDIVFQFGALTVKQAEYLQDQNRFVGIAVRTDYDRKTMRGKGFVYFAGDKGNERLKEGSWSMNDGAPLYHVMAHELGHVYGIPHTGGVEFQIMGEQYPALVMDKGMIESVTYEFTPRLFSYPNRWNDTDEGFFCVKPDDQAQRQTFDRFKSYFSVPDIADCIDVSIDLTKMQVRYKNEAESTDVRLAGTMIVDPLPQWIQNNPEALVTLNLPEEQTLVSEEAMPVFIKATRVIPLLMKTKHRLSGTYHPESGGLDRHITVTAEGNGGYLEIGGVFEDKYLINLYGQLSGLL